MGRGRRALAAGAAVGAVLAGCSLPEALGGREDAAGWERVTARGLRLSGPVEAYRTDHLIASGRYRGRDCLVEIAADGTVRCLPDVDRPPEIPSATALASNGDVILAVEWQDMADASPPAVWAGHDVGLTREALTPGPDADATAFIDVAASDDEALVVGTAPSAVCPHGAVQAWAVRMPGLTRFGGEGPCVDAGSPSPMHAAAGDAWLLVAGPTFPPGTTSAERPTEVWYAAPDVEGWATATWHRVTVPEAPELVSDVVVTLDGMVAGSLADRPVLLTVSGDRATVVDVPDEPLDPDVPTLLVADPGAATRPVVLAVQTPKGTRLWTQRQDGWYAVDGPPGYLTAAVEMDGATYLATRDKDGEVTLWVRRRTATDTSPPAYRAQR